LEGKKSLGRGGFKVVGEMKGEEELARWIGGGRKCKMKGKDSS
jgi:hypothetical protein